MISNLFIDRPLFATVVSLMLMGIVSKDSILIVEYTIMAQRDQGLSRFDSLIDSCSKRARPIVMTTIAMIAGMTQIAMGWAGDPSFRAPMGIAVIGGLVVSTVMSCSSFPRCSRSSTTMPAPSASVDPALNTARSSCWC